MIDASTPESEWLRALRRAANRPPERPRSTLHAVGAMRSGATIEIGSIEPALAARMAAEGLGLSPMGDEWHVHAPLDAVLARAAEWLRDAGLLSRWRGELLAVCDPAGVPIGRIERAAVRAFGIATDAVHLVGRTGRGDVWVQRRALDKATDAGLWDTLMGGQVAAGESVRDTLARETWEEAGLRVDELRAVEPLRRWVIRRPVAEGYMVETLHVFEAVVPDGLQPENRDGEVERFECLSRSELDRRLSAGMFTLEASLILAG